MPAGMGALFATFVYSAPFVRAGDVETLRGHGRDVLQNIKPLPPGVGEITYWEIKLGPVDVIGYAVISIEAVQQSDRLVYRYRNEMKLRFENNARIQASIDATLRPTFEPIEIAMERISITPDGEERKGLNRARVGDDEVALLAMLGGEEQSSKAPRPPSPFVFAIETLAQRIDVSSLPDFTLAEFDPQRGTAGDLKFASHELPDGTRTLFTIRAVDEQPSYQFWYDASGRLERWGEASRPALVVRTTKEGVDRVKESLRAAEEQWNRETNPPKRGE